MRGLSSCTEDDEALISENCRGTCSLGNRIVHIYVEGRKQIDDECASLDICPERAMEKMEKNGKKDILNDNNDLCDEKTGQCDDNTKMMTKSGTFGDSVNDHKNASIEVSRELSTTNHVHVEKKERETTEGKEDIPEVNGNVTKVEEKDYSEQKIIADPTEEPPPAESPVPGVPLLMPVCIAGLALAIPLSIYLVTRK